MEPAGPHPADSIAAWRKFTSARDADEKTMELPGGYRNAAIPH